MMAKPVVREADDRSVKRYALRFDKVFPVIIGSELFGDSEGVARNISEGGMWVEMQDPLPLGCVVTVRFAIPDSSGEVVARAEVKHHYNFNYATNGEPNRARGIGLRFVEFVESSADLFHEAFTRNRVLH